MVRTSRALGVGRVTRRGAAAILAGSCLVGLTSVASASTTAVGDFQLGRAYGISVQGTSLLALANIAGTADTGLVDGTPAVSRCAVDAPDLIIVGAAALCGQVDDGATPRVVARAAEVTLNLPILGMVEVVGAHSEADCVSGSGPTGDSKVAEVTLLGKTIKVAPGPNTKITVPGEFDEVTVTVIIDERITKPITGEITVNAVRLIVAQKTGPILDVVIASSYAKCEAPAVQGQV